MDDQLASFYMTKAHRLEQELHALRDEIERTYTQWRVLNANGAPVPSLNMGERQARTRLADRRAAGLGGTLQRREFHITRWETAE
jgi:hypothetical protein